MTTLSLNTNTQNKKREISNFILFSMGKFISIFGSAIYTFAIGLYVLKDTGSGLSFATTLILGSLPMILANPIAGVVADRYNKKKLVVLMDFLNGLLLAMLYLFSIGNDLSLPMIYGSTFLMNVFTTFFGISIEAAKPNMVSEKMLMNINSASKIIDSVSSILGPMIGGMVFAFFDIKFFILINSISFFASALSEVFIDFKFQDATEHKEKTKLEFKKEIIEGIHYLKGRKDLISMVSVFVFLNFFLGFSVSVPLPFIINKVLNLGSTYFGIIQGSFPVGMILGAIVIKKISEKVEYETLLRKTTFLISFCMLMVGTPIFFTQYNLSNLAYTIYYCFIMSIFGVAVAFVDIPIMYLFQKWIPENYRGRVLSLVMSIAKIILPVALILSGVLVNHIEAFFLPIVGGMLLFIFNIKSRTMVSEGEKNS